MMILILCNSDFFPVKNPHHWPASNINQLFIANCQLQITNWKWPNNLTCRCDICNTIGPWPAHLVGTGARAHQQRPTQLWQQGQCQSKDSEVALFLPRTQGARAGGGFYELHYKVQHHQGDWGYSLDWLHVQTNHRIWVFKENQFFFHFGGPKIFFESK